MHRLQAAAAIAAALFLLTAFASSPGPAIGRSKCTGWGSTLLPPETIRVYRHATDAVETVSFPTYVETVMAAEWGPTNPRETLKAGAVAVKQFAWYYTVNWRGYSSDGECFDVFDTSVDQVYDPEGHPPLAAHRAAVAASWGTHLRKNWRFFLTGYNGNPGEPTCGSGSTGWKLWQQGAADCGRKGYPMEAILRAYYEPYLEVVTPGRHDMTGDGWGDGGVLTPGESPARLRPLIYRTVPGSLVAPTTISDFAIPPASILDRVTADLTGDGREDLALLLNGSGGPRITVLRVNPSGTGFRTPVTWWSNGADGLTLTATGLRLVAGDYDGGGATDLGLVAPDPEAPGNSILYWFRATGDDLKAPVVGWQGILDTSRSEVWGGDFNGDGRADLAAMVDRGTRGLAVFVMPSTRTGGSLGRRVPWYSDAELMVRDVMATRADLDGDGRDDLLLDERMDGGGSRIVWYEAGDGAFTRRTAWESSTYSWARSKVGVADLNGNGRDDLLLLYDTRAGEGGGTAFDALLSQGTSLDRDRLLVDPALDWTTADPY